MAKNFLDKTGLAHYHEKVKELIEASSSGGGGSTGFTNLTDTDITLTNLTDGEYMTADRVNIKYYDGNGALQTISDLSAGTYIKVSSGNYTTMGLETVTSQYYIFDGVKIYQIVQMNLTAYGMVIGQVAEIATAGNLKTINGNSLIGEGDIAISGGGKQLTEISGAFSIGNLSAGVYLIRQGAVANGEYTIQNDTIGQVIVYDNYKALLTVEGNTTWNNAPRNIKYTYDTTTSTIVSVNVTSIYDSASISYVDNHTEVYNITGSSVSVASATAKTIATLTIPAGTYIVNAHVNFPANSTGVRKIYIGTQADYYSNTRGLADNRLASSHQATMSNISTILKAETDTTYYLNVYQNSGSSLSCAGGLRAMRIGDYKEYQAGL